MILISFLTTFSFLFSFRTKSKALRQYEAKMKRKRPKISKHHYNMQQQLLYFDVLVSMMTPQGYPIAINIF